MPPARLVLLLPILLVAACATGDATPDGPIAQARAMPAVVAAPARLAPPPRAAAADVAAPAASSPESCVAIEAEMSDPTAAAEVIRATREGMQAMRGLGTGGQVARTALGVAAGFVPYAGGVVDAVLDGVESAGRLAAQERMNASLDAMLLRQEVLLTRYGAAGCHRQGAALPGPPLQALGTIPGRGLGGVVLVPDTGEAE